MIVVTVAVKDGARMRGETLEFEELDGKAMAEVDEVVLEMKDHLERLKVRHEVRRKKGE